MQIQVISDLVPQCACGGLREDCGCVDPSFALESHGLTTPWPPTP